jgi:hypothetical protein
MRRLARILLMLVNHVYSMHHGKGKSEGVYQCHDRHHETGREFWFVLSHKNLHDRCIVPAAMIALLAYVVMNRQLFNGPTSVAVKLSRLKP